jgi:MFS family permease
MQDAFALSGTEAARRTGVALMVTAAGLVATQLARLSTRSGIYVLSVGALLALAAMAILWLADSFPGQLVGMGLFGIGLGIVLPSALGLLTMIAEAAGDQGRVGGLAGAAQGFGMVFGPLVGAASYEADHAAPYIVGFVFLTIVIAITAPAVWRRRARATSRVEHSEFEVV